MSKKIASTLPFTYVDLFAGCGGLSLGLESEGGKLLIAVERSDMAAETFFHNLIAPIKSKAMWNDYISQTVEDQVKQGLLVKELKMLLDSEISLKYIVRSKPDLVVGGPPCQGFSLAGRRNSEDVRNQLPWQFLEFVKLSQPKMVVIENVVGMRHKFSNNEEGDTFYQLQQALCETTPGYVVQGVQVNALHYGAPQHRPRLMIIGLRTDIAKSKGIVSSGELWSSNFIDKLDMSSIPKLAPIPTLKSTEIRTVGEAINDLHKISRKTVPATGFAKAMQPSFWGLEVNATITNHIPRVHQEKTQMRFRLYQYLNSIGVSAKIVNLASEKPTKSEKMAISKTLTKAAYPAKSPDGKVLAKNELELIDLIIQLRTKKHSQKVLDWNQPARTVVTIGDDYVHPFEPRTFTVRELARFQGFPNGFEFRAKETTGGLNRRTDVPQYSQVGNAVSPLLAKAVGSLVRNLVS